MLCCAYFNGRINVSDLMRDNFPEITKDTQELSKQAAVQSRGMWPTRNYFMLLEHVPESVLTTHLSGAHTKVNAWCRAPMVQCYTSME